jgi:hypothetical protein
VQQGFTVQPGQSPTHLMDALLGSLVLQGLINKQHAQQDIISQINFNLLVFNVQLVIIVTLLLWLLKKLL